MIGLRRIGLQVTGRKNEPNRGAGLVTRKPERRVATWVILAHDFRACALFPRKTLMVERFLGWTKRSMVRNSWADPPRPERNSAGCQASLSASRTCGPDICLRPRVPWKNRKQDRHRNRQSLSRARWRIGGRSALVQTGNGSMVGALVTRGSLGSRFQ